MIDRKINVLVTGCGGDIGQSVGKILNSLDFIGSLYGCDISDKNAAKFIYDNFFIGLPCSDPNYLNNLHEFIIKYKIDFVIPISEPELRFFSKENINKIGLAPLVTASSEALKVGFDKLFTAEFLKKENLPFPVTHSIDSVKSIEKFPAILKSRTGSGSSTVSIVYDNASFISIKAKEKDFIVQEYLEGDNGEYTCGVFRSKDGLTRSIIIKRELMGGFTGYGEVIKNEEISTLLYQIAEKIDLIGSINVQLRLTIKGAVVFEINPRFSSTVRFRDLLGFKDVQWSLEDMMNISVSEYKETSIGKKIYKGFNEYIQ
ncbi:ATP-grasp domain-containing protein [Flavobacterium sp.]|uniref:ATP-grasp domain-containing protein n=1 Tax=Flavobacterium sp. TaxID=239 RepID=UPI0031E2C54C